MFRSVFILFLITTNIFSGFCQNNLDDELISYYPFTENARDKVGKNHGEVFNAAIHDARCGDNAYFFNGGDAYIDCGNDPSLNYHFSSMTIAVWIHPSVIQDNELSTIVAKWGFNERRDHFGLWINPTYKIIAAFSTPGTMEEGVFSQTSLEPENWHHVVTTWKRNGEIRIYVDGNLDRIGRQAGRGINARSDLSLKIGRQIVRKNRAYKGYIDELRVYSRALDESEVAELYNLDRTQCEKITLRGTVYNKKTKLPTRANVIVENLETGVIVNKTQTADDATYEIDLPIGGKYAFYAEKENFLSENRNIDTKQFEINTTVNRDLFLVPVQVGETLTLNNIFFEFNKSDLQKESFSELNRIIPFFNKYPNLNIEIAGHTDNVGSDDYNQKLSESRANSVMSYLLSKGISQQRIRSKGYGELEPVATNDTDEGRQENRRVEFRIMEN